MNSSNVSTIRDQLANHLKRYVEQRVNNKKQQTTGQHSTVVAYGTAGFRGEAAKIEHLFYNVGLISALRCLVSDGNNIGVMITASHNPVQDNGIKLIESNGEMLQSEWEPIVERFCNTHDHGQLMEQLDHLIEQYNIKPSSSNIRRVLIGMDTRPSSEALATLLKQGLDAWSPFVAYIDYGQLTTPALHYLVAESNRKQVSSTLPLRTYYQQLISGLVDIFSRTSSYSSHYCPSQLVVDCANGVGSETMLALCRDENFSKLLPVKLINRGDGILNQLCGADYVKTTKLPPSGANDTNARYASLDGDADRVVYFYLDQEGGEGGSILKLLDGDKIMALYALYLKETLKRCRLEGDLSLGIVQTAYANGASTDYMTKVLNIHVDFADTGVKNLHKQAVKYDLGIYFEANGHGTIWISPKARSLIESRMNEDVDNNNQHPADFKRLLAIVNNYTGDAISDILVVETILRHYDWDVRKWYSLYQDRPNSLIQIKITDRSLIKTTNAGRTCTEPKTLQPVIDSMVAEFGLEARCFVRASGTENVVRVYAEADCQELAERLARKVGDEVTRQCNKSS